MNKTRAMIKNVFITLVFFISLNQVSADTYKWNDRQYKLPFPKAWLSKGPKKNPKDPLVFLDTETSNPRIVGRFYETNLQVSSDNLSDFKKGFLKSKNRWLANNNARLEESLSFKVSKSIDSLSYKLSFSTKNGIFTEFGRFQQCRGSSMGIKVLVPKERNQKVEKLALYQKMEQANLCP